MSLNVQSFISRFSGSVSIRSLLPFTIPDFSGQGLFLLTFEFPSIGNQVATYLIATSKNNAIEFDMNIVVNSSIFPAAKQSRQRINLITGSTPDLYLLVSNQNSTLSLHTLNPADFTFNVEAKRYT